MGDLEIRSGGVVAVDTESLREAAHRLELIADGLDGVGAELRRSALIAHALPSIETAGAADGLGALAWRARAIAERHDVIAGRLRAVAAVYEAIELQAQRAAAEAAGDLDAMILFDARLGALFEAHPWARLHATWAAVSRDLRWAEQLTGPLGSIAGLAGAAPGAALLTLAWGLTGAARSVGLGVIPPGAGLRPGDDGARVRPLPSYPTTAAAPSSLAAAAARIPAGYARVRVERYTMPDGTRQFAVYVRGTTSEGGADPFDGESNAQLYTGERSASYEAVLAALRDAGAEPGDVVHAFGHSQGAMIVSRLALESGYDTQTVVTLGSPVEAAVGGDTLSVTVRHTDDPVAALAGGGHDVGVGAPSSFVAERAIDPGLSIRDADPMQAHHLDAYVDTAALLDESTDPRMDAVRRRLAQLDGAVSVEAAEYSAVRISPSGADGG